MPYVITAHWMAAPGKEEVIRDALEALAVATRGEPGHVQYLPLVAEDEPQKFSIFEVYVDADAFQAHLDSPHFAEPFHKVALPALESRRRQVFRPIEEPTMPSADGVHSLRVCR